MQVKFSIGPDAGNVTITRDESDPKFYRSGGWGGGHGWEAEHTLMYHIKKFLNERGFHLIKKRMSSDGHLYGSDPTPYICPPVCQTVVQAQTPQIYIYDGNYALRCSNEDWNKGEVAFIVAHA